MSKVQPDSGPARYFVVTVDGPAGSGKSSLARAVAKKINASHLNSGLLYRAVAKILCTQELLQQQELPATQDFLAKQDLKILDALELRPYQGVFQVWAFEQNWSNLLYSKELDRGSAWLATNIVIRDFVLKMQRSAKELNNLVIDGRDCGTIVFPEANLKIFLTASSKARALRIASRSKISFADVAAVANIEQKIIERDLQDQNRVVSPLKPALDAIIVDNSTLTLDQTVAKVLKLFMDRKINGKSVK